MLATGKDPDVRACVAAGPSTPLSLLEALAKDEKHFVRCRVRDRVPSILSYLAQAADRIGVGSYQQLSTTAGRLVAPPRAELLWRANPNKGAV